jgi:FKBP-type peptidyl-prolyl cis-trans isomerase
MTSAARYRHLALLLGLAAALSTLPLQAQQAPAAPAAAAAGAGASDRNAISYSLGVSMGQQLRSTGVTAEEVNGQRLAQGLHDALGGKVSLTDADRRNITQWAVDANHGAAARFLAENGKKPGVITTASGLQYLVLAPGSGASPQLSDKVTVNYRGTLLDGTEFDSSYKRGEPVPLNVSRVIPGWTEALQLMKPGSKYRLFVPPQLAYDLRAQPGIPPGSLLIFEVELLSIAPSQPPAGTNPATGPPATAAPK